MALVKAHIVLAEDKAVDEEARGQLLEELQEKFDIKEINEERYNRYGVLTCEIDQECLDDVRQIEGIAGVEVDRERYLE